MGAFAPSFSTYTRSRLLTLVPPLSGINHLRIPTGFWAWIPTVDGEPYLNCQSCYQAQMDRVLSYAHARGMYAVIDLHGLPGSQNGEQASGHNTTTPAFFNNVREALVPSRSALLSLEHPALHSNTDRLSPLVAP